MKLKKYFLETCSIYLLLLGLWCITPLTTQAQTTLINQAQVDTIRNMLGESTVVTGNLTIGNSTDITNLDSLYFLTKITGNLEIINNSMLEDVGDFPVLDSIGGYFRMYENGILRNAGDFPVLKHIGGYFLIRTSDSLTSVGSFPRLTTIGGYFSVRGTKILRVLYAFPALTSIGMGSAWVPSLGTTNGVSIVVEDNPLLEYCCVLTRLREGGGLTISGDSYVNNNFEGCSSIAMSSCNLSVRLSVGDTVRSPFFSEETAFTLYSNARWQLSRLNPGDADWVTSLSSGGVSNSDSLISERDARIMVNHTPNTNSESRMAQLLISFLDTMDVATPADTLTLIQGLKESILQSASAVNVSHVLGRTEISIFSNVRWRLRKSEEVDWLTILSSGTTNVTDSLEGGQSSVILPEVSVVTLMHEAVPTSSSRSSDLILSAIDSNGTKLLIPPSITITVTQLGIPPPYTGNITLTTQAEVDDIRTTLGRATAIVGNLTIGTSTDITDLSPLNFLTEITGNLEIRNNSMLEDVGEFPALDSIGGNFLIHSNAILRNAGNFPMLSGIGGYFLIRASASLTSVGSFPRLTTIGESFSVRGATILRVLYEFPALTSIGMGSAWVPSVSSGTGKSVDNVSIVVEDNPLLFYCCGLSRFFSGRSNPASGSVHITNNSTSCNSEEEISCDISSRLPSDTFMLPFHTTDTTFIFHSPTRWRLSQEGTAADWITGLSLDGGSTNVTNNLMGDRTASITVTYAQNGTAESRTVRLLISFLDTMGNVLTSPMPYTLTLIQEEVMPTLQLPPDTVNVSHFSGSTGITLTANNVKWRLRKDSGADWITMLSVGAISHTDTLTATNNSFVPTDTVVTITYDKLPISLADRSTSLVLEAIDNDGGVLDDLSPITITLTQAIAPYMGDITLTTQAEVNTILDTLGNPRVTAIVGNLIIGTSTDITNLDSLRFLTEITGNFEIGQNGMTNGVPNGNSALVDIGDFSFLQKIGGGYYVTQNTNLVNGGNFPALDSIGGYFFIRSNSKLESVGTFPRLKDIGTYFSIRSNDSLRSLYKFPALTSIGKGSPYVPSTNGETDNTSIVVEQNPLLFYCCGLSRFFSGRSNAALGSVYIGSNSTGCDSEEDISCDIFDQPLTDTLRLPFDTTGITFILHSQTRWRLSREEGTESNWITGLSSDGGSTNVNDNLMGYQTASITVTYAQNGTAESRTARLRISFLDTMGGELTSPMPYTLTLIQEEVMPTLQPSPSTVNVSELSGSTNITLRSNNVKWRLRKDSVADWLTMLSVGTTSHTNTLIVTNNNFVPTDTVVTITYEELPISLTNRSALLVLETIDDEGNVPSPPSSIMITFTQMVPFHPRSITLTTQAQVNAIRDTLGNPRITVIDGYLQIGPSSDINNLDSLRFLTEITENFFIGGPSANNSALTNIGDFPNLQKIGGGYSVAENSELIHGGNFPALESIGDKFIASGGTSGSQNDEDVLHGYFFIRTNPKLESVGTFPLLKRIGTSFTVRGHDSLRFLYEFPALTSIGTGNPYVPSANAANVGTPRGIPGNTSIVVEDNSNLSDCSTLTDFLLGGTHLVSGGRYINNNATGCNSGGEIKASAPHTIMLTSHTDGDSIAIAYNEDTTQTIMFSIGGGATGWTSAITGDGFITLDTDMNVAQDAGVAITVTATPTENTGVARIAVITFTTMGGTGAAATFTVTITQAAAPPMLTLSSPSTVTLAHDVVAADTIKFTVGGSASGWSSSITYTPAGANFITLAPDMNTDQRGTVTVVATPIDNPGAARIAMITFTTEGGTGAAKDTTVTITQSAAPPIFMLTSDSADTVAYGAETARDITFNVGGGATGWRAGVIDRDDDTNDFVTLSKDSGSSGLDTIKITTTVNTGEARVDTVVVGTGGDGEATDTIIVTQEGVPTISLTPVDGMIVIDSAATDTTITFNVGGSATGWTASSDQSFVTLDMTSGASGTGLMATVTENMDVLRTATITITTTGQLGAAKTATVMITQTGAEGSPTLSVTTSSGDATVAYTTDSVEIVFTVGNATGWEGMISYGAGVDTFLTLTGNPSDIGEVRIKASVMKNDSVERSAKIILNTTGQGSEFSSAKDSLTITQDGAPPTFMLTSDSAETIAYDAESASNILFTVGGGATGWTAVVIDGDSDNNFVMLDKTSGSAGLDTIKVTTLNENMGLSRMDTVVITTVEGTGVLKDTVIVTQQEAPPTLMLTSEDTDTIVYNENTASNILFTVGGGATGWTAVVIDGDSGNNFVMLDKTSGSAGLDTIKVTTLNENVGLSRMDTVVITTVEGTGVLKDTVIVTQAGAPPMLDVSIPTLQEGSNDTTIAYNAMMTDIDIITFEVGGGATGWWATVIDGDGNDFLTLSSDTTGNAGTATISVTSRENSGKARMDTIVITTVGGFGNPLKDTIVITQAAGPPTLMLTSDVDETIAYDAETASDITFEVGGGASGWMAEVIDRDANANNFVMLDKTFGSAGSDTIKVAVSDNMGLSRIDTIKITTDGGTGELDTMISITQEEVPTLSVDISSFSLGHDEGEVQNIVVTSGGSATGWTASSDSTFVVFTTLSGVSGGSATFTLSSNDTGSERTAEIVITTEGSLGTAVTETVTITQEEAPTLSVDNSSFTLGHDVVGAQNIMVSVGGSATEWNATTPDSAFVTITTSNGGNGDNATFTISSNDTGSERTAEIVITTDGSTGSDSTVTVMITQEAAPTLSVDNSSFSLGHDEGDAQNIVVTSGGSATGWTASSDSTFVVFTTLSGVSGGSATFTLSSNDTGSERAAEIVITTEGSLGTAVTETVTITQEESPTLMLSTPTTVDIDYNVTAEQTITFDVGGSATGWDSDTVYSPVGTGFITLTLPMNNAETGTVTVEAKPTTENAGAARSVTITFYTTGQLGDSVTAQVTITQGAAPNSPMLMGLSFRSGDTVRIEHNDSTTVTNIGFTAGGNATGWTASSDNSFVTLSSMSGNSTDPVMLMATLTGMNRGVERSATITISTSGPGTSPATATLTITQGGAAPMLSVSTMAVDTIGHDDVSSQTITFGVGGGAMGWMASSDQSFVTLEDTTGDSGTNIDVEATFVDANTTGAARTAIITITTRGGTGDAETRMVTLTQEEVPTLSVDNSSFTLGHDEGDVQNIVVTSGGSATGWTASSVSTFVTFTASSGVSGGSATFTLSSNDTGSERTAEIMITTTGSVGTAVSETVTIAQDAAPVVVVPATLMVSTFEDTTVSDEGGSLSISFTLGGTAKGWTSTVKGADFITLTPNESTSDTNKVVTVVAAYEANAGVERTDTIVFTTGDVADTIVITQSASPTSPALTLISDSTGTLAHGNGSTSVIVFSVANATWTAASSETFVTLDMSSGSAGDNLMVTATADANDGVERMAIITITATDGTITLTKMVTLTQEAAPVTLDPPTLMVSTFEDTTINDEEGSLSISFTLGGTAKGWTSEVKGDEFITLDPAMSVSDTNTAVTVMATYEENTGVERTDTIVFTTGDVADTIVITQSSGPPIFTLTSDDDETIAHDAETASDITFKVGGGATGWWAGVIDRDDDTNDFVTLSDSSGYAGLDTIKVTTTVNTGVARVDTVVVGTGGEGEATDTIIVTQEAVPTISLTDPVDGTISTDYNELTKAITFDVGGSATDWTASSDQSFVTLDITSGVSGTGLMATVTENRDVLRTATITITTVGQLGSEKTATVMITQTGAPNSPTLIVTTPSGDTTVAYTATTTSDSVEIAFTVGNAMGWASMISYGSGVDEFVTLTGNRSDTGEVRIKVAVTENDSVARSAKIVFSTTGQVSPFSSAKDSLTITQGGAPPTFMLTSANTDTLAHNATVASAITFNIGGGATGWMSDITYSEGADRFITLTGDETMRGDVRVTVASEVNTGVERSATITISTVGGTGEAVDVVITIVQEAGPPKLTLTSGDAISIATPSATVSTDSIEVIFTVGGGATGWTATLSENSFLMLSKMSGLVGMTTIKVAVTANTGAERMATITLSTTGEGSVDTTITITQAEGTVTPPVSNAPTLMLTSPNNVSIANTATTPTDSTEIEFAVGGGAMGWTATLSENSFLTLSKENGLVGMDTIKVAATANTGAERTAMITLSTTGEGSVDTTITITQAAGTVTPPVSNPPTLMLTSPNNVSIANTATTSTDSTEIEFAVGGGATGWTATVNQNFVTLGKSTGSSGTVTLKMAVTANTGAERMATITLSTTGEGSVDTTITITQAGAPLSVSTQISFTLYPNPTTGKLTIEGISGDVQIYLHDFVGKEVFTSSLTSSRNTIDLSHLPSGMYVITLQGEDKTMTEVLIIVN